MTYRMQSLGAAQLTPEQMSYLTQIVLASGGCAGGFKASAQALNCLTAQQVQWLGACYLGTPLPGVTPAQLDGACMAMSACGLFDKPGCPSDGTALMPTIPDCLTDALYAEVAPVIDYCKANPTFKGSNKQFNAACWSMSRYQTTYQKLMATPRCGAALVNPPPVAPRPPVVVSAPPPPDTSAPIMHDDTVTAASAPDSTPASVDVPMSPPALIDNGPSPDEGMSTTAMALIGVGGVLALGLGYMLLKKRK